MIPASRIPPEPPQILVIAPAYLQAKVVYYVESYSNSLFNRQFNLVFVYTAQEAMKIKDFYPASGILCQELLGAYDYAYLQTHFYTSFLVVTQSQFLQTPKVFDYLCQTSLQFLKQKVAYYARAYQNDLMMQYKLLCYYAQLILLIKPPNIDKSTREVASKGHISFFAALLLVVTQLEFAGNNYFRQLFDCKNEFTECLERFSQDLQQDIKRGLTVSNLSLYTCVFDLKCELMVMQYQKRLYATFNESEPSVRGDGTVEVAQSYLHVRNAKSEIASPSKTTRHSRTKSEYLQYYESGGYLAYIENTLYVLYLNFDNFQLVKIAEELKIKQMSEQDDEKGIYYLQAANLLLNSQSYQFILYLFLLNFVFRILRMILLPLVEIREACKLYLTDGAGSELYKVYSKILGDAYQTVCEPHIQTGFLFDIYDCLQPPEFGTADVDFLRLEALDGLSWQAEDEPIFYQLNQLANVAYVLREMLAREAFGDLFNVIKPVNFLIHIFNYIARIDIMNNVQADTEVEFVYFSVEPPEMPKFADFENMILSDRLELDFCERFCKSQAYSVNYLLSNALMCKMIRTLRYYAVRVGQHRLVNRLSYALAYLYKIRGLHAEAQQLVENALLNQHSMLELGIDVSAPYSSARLENTLFFLDAARECDYNLKEVYLSGTLKRSMRARFGRITYKNGDTVELIVYFQAKTRFDKVVFSGVFNDGQQTREFVYEIAPNTENHIILLQSLTAFAGVISFSNIAIVLFSGYARAVIDYSNVILQAYILNSQSYIYVCCTIDKIYLGETANFAVEVCDARPFLLQVVENLEVKQTEENKFDLQYTAFYAAPLVLLFYHRNEQLQHRIAIELPVQYSIKFLPLKFVQIEGVKYFYDLFVQTFVEMAECGKYTIEPYNINGYVYVGQETTFDNRYFCYVQRFTRNNETRSYVEKILFSTVKYNFAGKHGCIPIERHFKGFSAPEFEMEPFYDRVQKCSVPFRLYIKITGFGRLSIYLCYDFIVLGCQRIDLALFGEYLYIVRLIYERPGRKLLTYRGKYYGKSVEGCLGEVLLEE